MESLQCAPWMAAIQRDLWLLAFSFFAFFAFFLFFLFFAFSSFFLFLCFLFLAFLFSFALLSFFLCVCVCVYPACTSPFSGHPFAVVAPLDPAREQLCVPWAHVWLVQVLPLGACRHRQDAALPVRSASPFLLFVVLLVLILFCVVLMMRHACMLAPVHAQHPGSRDQ